MHAETLAYLLHQLPCSMKPHGAPIVTTGRPAPPNPMIDIAAGTGMLGQARPAPPFWRKAGDHWIFRGMLGDVPLPLDWPVWTTWRQAAAYAAWRGLELPTEAQHLRAANMSEPSAERDNFDYRSWDPVPVDNGDE